MASTCKYFEEDAVYRCNKKGQIEFGLVLENSEFVSSDEEEEEDKALTDWERMKRGHIRVAWHPRGREEVLLEKRVKLFDRSLMPGDIVRKLVKGKDTQLGYCRSTDVKATVQLVGSKQVIIDVKSTVLRPLEDFSGDIAVFFNSWVGIIKVVRSDVTVKSNDGSRCILTDDDALDLDDILERRERVSEFRKYSFYPGQRLWGPVHCFEKARWLHTSKEVQSLLHKPGRSLWVTVEDVKVVSMDVQWLCRAYCEGASMAIDVEQPKYIVQGDDLKNLKMMHIFEPCALQTGDRNYYVVQETDSLVSLDDWKKDMMDTVGTAFGGGVEVAAGDKNNTASANRLNNNNNNNTIHHSVAIEQTNTNNEEMSVPTVVTTDVNGSCGLTLNESDFEDVDDEDGGNSSDTGSVTSRSTASSAGTGVWNIVQGGRRKNKKVLSLATKMLKKKKLRRARKKLILDAIPANPGDQVVTETLVTETKAAVVWQDGSVENNIPSSVLYPIHHLDGHEFFPGDFVLENKDQPKSQEYGVVKKVDHTGRTAEVTWLKTYMAGSDPNPVILEEQEVSVYDIKDHPDFRYRPGSCVIRVANFQDANPENTAGQVLDIHPTGKVEVFWVSGQKSYCYPQELYRIGEYDSDDLWGEDDSGGEDDSWETESEEQASDLPYTDDSDVELDEDTKPCKTRSKKTPTREKVVVVEEGEEEASAETRNVKLQLGEDTGISIKQRLLSKIEKLRAGMARIEEVFVQDPMLQNSALMRKLLEIYKHCRLLDQLLGTFYFHEKHLQGLVDHLRHRGRINSAQHMADQITRLFSNLHLEGASAEGKSVTNSSRRRGIPNTLEEQVEDVESISTDIQIEASSGHDEPILEDSPVKMAIAINKECKSDKNSSKLDYSLLNDITIDGVIGGVAGAGGTASEVPNACRQLFQLLKCRLLKAHEDLQELFGMSLAKASDAMKLASNDDSPKHQNTNTNTTNTNTTNTTTLNHDEEEDTLNPSREDGEDGESQLHPASGGDGVDADEFKSMMASTAGQGVFSQLGFVPDTHKFKLSIFQPVDPRAFFKTVRKEMALLKNSLPGGIVVKAFEDRMDLFSVLIKGSERTPYQDGIFLFDFQLPNVYPKSPPLCHYVSYCSDRLNPNLYEGGKVCVSLLGTWGGKGTEIWNPITSNLLQVIVSIQGLILVAEPYYNEAGYERQRGTQQGRENSRMYNEMVLLKLVQATSKLIANPPEIFKDEIVDHFKDNASRMVLRLEKWLDISESWNGSHPMTPTSPTVFRELQKGALCREDEAFLPEYPLLPASKGFCLTLRKSLIAFKEMLISANIYN